MRSKANGRYCLAKSSLRLGYLEKELNKTQHRMDKHCRKFSKLTLHAKELAGSVPLVAEAGPLEEDERRLWSHILIPTPKVFLPQMELPLFKEKPLHARKKVRFAPEVGTIQPVSPAASTGSLQDPEDIEILYLEA